MVGVPSNVIIPWVGVEFSNARAQIGPSVMPVTICCIGQRLSTGTVAAETMFLAWSAEEVAVKAGVGSMLHRMAIKIFKNNITIPVWFIGLDDDGAAAKAKYEFTISGTFTEAGELYCYIAGERYSVAVSTDDTPTDVAAALVAEINADVELQGVASNVAGAVSVECRNGGLIAGDLDIRFNYNEGEEFPAGLAVTAVSETVAGSGDPDVGDALAVFGDKWFNVIINPYTDTTSVDAIEDFLDIQAGPMVQRDGLCVQSVRDTYANLLTYGTAAARNNQFIATYMAYKRLESTYELSSAIAAQIAVSVAEDPAVPLHRLALKGIHALDPNDRWEPTERNALAHAGIATLTDDTDVQTEATVTMYLKNSAGAIDTSYQQQNMIFQLMAARYSFVYRIKSRYPRAKLTKNTEGLKSNQQIMSVDVGETEAVAWFRQQQRAGNFELGQEVLDQFIAVLSVKRDIDMGGTNVNRLNWLLPPDMMNQFIVGSGNMEFRQ